MHFKKLFLAFDNQASSQAGVHNSNSVKEPLDVQNFSFEVRCTLLYLVETPVRRLAPERPPVLEVIVYDVLLCRGYGEMVGFL